MKKITFVLFMLMGVSAFAYQAGSTSRPQFSAAPAKAADTQAANKDEKSNIPGQQAVQTRSFTSYGSRTGSAWRQGVQTKTVQTQSAAAAQSGREQAAKDKMAQVNVSPAKTAAPVASQPEKPAPAGKSAPAAAQPAQAGTDPAAMMQQLQSLQGLMGGMPGAQGSKGAAAGNAGAAMPAGMPDMSALMNMMGGQGQPGKK